ncbi:MAG: hypothetical protein LC772_13095, partial [Chloroflexi bacterium]|nr:hypothetical protein [Chloroflexota bacterium]
MFPLLRRLLRRTTPESPTAEAPPASDEHRLSLERELQALKLDRQELERTQARLRSDLEQHRVGEQAR